MIKPQSSSLERVGYVFWERTRNQYTYWVYITYLYSIEYIVYIVYYTDMGLNIYVVHVMYSMHKYWRYTYCIRYTTYFAAAPLCLVLTEHLTLFGAKIPLIRDFYVVWKRRWTHFKGSEIRYRLVGVLCLVWAAKLWQRKEIPIQTTYVNATNIWNAARRREIACPLLFAWHSIILYNN